MIEQNWDSTGETSNGYTRYKATGTISSAPAASATSLTICIRFASGTAFDGSGRRALTGVQFEAGPFATPYEGIPIQTQLANCQRYYQTLTCWWSGYTTSTNSYDQAQTFSYNTTMRTVPNVTGTVAASIGKTSIIWPTQYADSCLLGFAGDQTDVDEFARYRWFIQADAEL